MNHEVLVVGSGAGGGMIAYALTQAGIDVLMLEAGRDYDPIKEAAMFNLPREAPLRGDRTPDKPGGYYDAAIVDNVGEPYTVAPGSRFYWGRARVLGGRTNHWGRNVPRYGPDDFKPLSNTGHGIDWPLTYDDIAPYYDKLEALMGVNGSEGECPASPNPNPATRQEPPAPRAYEMLFAKACDELRLPVFANPTAILTQPKNGRAACFYATRCIRGCAIDAAFQSPTGFIKPALKTGNLTLITEAMAYQITVDKQGKASGAHYIDKRSGQRKTVYAKVVVLAASAMESCRILLNSKSDAFPRGLANTTGLVGRNITDSPVTGCQMQIPALENMPPHNEDGTSEPHIAAPWTLLGKAAREHAKIDFFGGYRLRPSSWSGRVNPPDMLRFPGYLSLKKGLYGAALKTHMRRYYGSIVSISAFCGMPPNEQCYCELDPEVKDRWGIPVLRFHWQWSEDDIRRITHAYDTAKAIAKQMGGKVINDRSPREGALPLAGGASHEIGGAIMGSDAKTSVVNSYSQTWDVPNLYLADGAPFTTHAEKNPTLTIMALAWRAADNIIERFKAQQL